MLFFVLVGVQEKKYIYFRKKKEKKEKKKQCGYWDLISFPDRSSFTRFTDVYTHTFMLKRRLYNT